MVINALGGHAVGAPVLGRPNPADFDGICVITIISPLVSACIGRLGRGVPTDSNERSSDHRRTCPPLLRGNQSGLRAGGAYHAFPEQKCICLIISPL